MSGASVHQQQTQAALAAFGSRWNLEVWMTDDSHPPNDPYLETHWLPIVGPSCFVLHRRLIAYAVNTPVRPAVVDPGRIGVQVGLSSRTDIGSPVIRVAARLVVFRLARLAPGGLAVRLNVPDLNDHQQARRIAALDGRETIPA